MVEVTRDDGIEDDLVEMLRGEFKQAIERGVVIGRKLQHEKDVRLLRSLSAEGLETTQSSIDQIADMLELNEESHEQKEE